MPNSLENQAVLHDRILRHFQDHPEFWGEVPNSKIELIETHGASVLLGSHFAVKIKKPVLFDHMDYSTAERRKAFCDIELERNARTAKELYIGVFPLHLTASDEFKLTPTADSNSPVEYFVKMHRFKSGDRLDEVAARQILDRELCLSLAEDIAAFHKSAKIIRDDAEIPDFEDIIHQNFQQLYDFCPDMLDRGEVDQFLQTLRAEKDHLSPLINAQAQADQVRVGHGDLHLQNICLFNGKARIFDAVEYHDGFTISDILYDLVFLLMDLIDKGQTQAATTILNEYVTDMGWLWSPERFEALRLMPFYLSLRAGIRCHVAANRALQCRDEDQKQKFIKQAQDLFQTAAAYLTPAKARLYAIGGFSGSGKSTLARALAAEILPAPGAIILRTDVIRRSLIGADKYSPMPQSAYTPEISDKVYQQMRTLAATITGAGISVILDAVFDRSVDRDRIDNLAREIHIPFQGIWLDVSREKMRERISGRTRDASDATIEILEAQLLRSEGIKTHWLRVNADGNPAENEDTLRRALDELN